MATKTIEDLPEGLREWALQALAEGCGFAGHVPPKEAWEALSSCEALLVDVRSAEELSFVGRVPDALHVPWATGLSLVRNPRFAKDLEKAAGGQGQADSVAVPERETLAAGCGGGLETGLLFWCGRGF